MSRLDYSHRARYRLSCRCGATFNGHGLTPEEWQAVLTAWRVKHRKCETTEKGRTNPDGATTPHERQSRHRSDAH